MKSGVSMSQNQNLPDLESMIELCDVCHHHHPHLPTEAPADEVLYKLADL